MNTIAIVLLVMFVLFLIDKNSVWRQTFKVALGLTLAGAVVTGGVYGWYYWSDYHTQKLHVAAVSACIARNNPSVRNSCEENTEFQLPAGYKDGTPVQGSVDYDALAKQAGAIDSIDLSAGLVPKSKPAGAIDFSDGLVPRPAWIYVDIFEQLDGIPAAQPKAPIQIAQMIKKNANCIPGSITYGTDNVEWICVQPEDAPKGMPSGAISVPGPAGATFGPAIKDPCDPKNDPFVQFGGHRTGCGGVTK